MKRIFTMIAVMLNIASLSAAPTVHHRLFVTIDPGGSSFDATDQITLQQSEPLSSISFVLNKALTVTCETPGFQLIADTAEVRKDDPGMDREESDQSSGLVQARYILKGDRERKGGITVTLKFRGVIHYPIKQIGAEYARGFSQTPGIIDGKGVYLAGSTFWIPQFGDALMTFELTTTLPQTWNVVSQGKRTRAETKMEKRIIRWSSPEPMEEIYLIAAPFMEYSAISGGTDIMAFLRTPDSALAKRYIETTAQYLGMYQKLIGPYPFSKFALVENFWETGYGMPSFTLLGEQVIRFPFILHSSYPHELLHNYWGNSVYVDFSSGNWCEGLTAYMADHLISEQRGQGEEYRRTTLQKYTDYVTSSNDFPLSKFHSRTNPSSEAIGYGKCMMVWDMLREEIGDEKFVQGIQNFYREKKFKSASFTDLQTAFEQVSRKNLGLFFDQWTKRTGAPELSIDSVMVTQDSLGYHIHFTLMQNQPDSVFLLSVPVAVFSSGKADIKHLVMSQKHQSYDLVFSDYPQMVQVDPQFHLFRKLHHDEVPPSLSKILGMENVLILLPSAADSGKLDYYRDLATLWAADSTKKIIVKMDREVAALPDDRGVWVFGWENLHADAVKKMLMEYNTQLEAGSVRISKTLFSTDTNSIVLTARNPGNQKTAVALVSVDRKDAVKGLARKLPHYGKYSYLIFTGTEPTNIGKGEWGSMNSPLSVKIVGEDSSAVIFPELPKKRALGMLEGGR